jgi:hypothetical protein
MSKIVVADLYQLAMMDGKPSKDHKKLVRKGVKVQKDWVDKINENWADTSKVYEIDMKATEKYYEESQKANELRDKEKELKQAANVDVLKEVVTAAVSGSRKKKDKDEPKTE